MGGDGRLRSAASVSATRRPSYGQPSTEWPATTIGGERPVVIRIVLLPISSNAENWSAWPQVLWL
eukprot:6329711-Prymnesium_polylepis.1